MIKNIVFAAVLLLFGNTVFASTYQVELVEDASKAATCFELFTDLNKFVKTEAEFLKRYEKASETGYQLYRMMSGEVVVATVGFSVIHDLYWDKSMHIDVLVVHPDYRRQGIGAELMAHIKRLAAEQGCTKLALETAPSNTSAQAFYKAQGFVESGLEYRYYPK